MKDIEELLNRYFEGETSLEEEERLKSYFYQNEIDKRYEVYAPLFKFFDEEKQKSALPQSQKQVKKYFKSYIWAGVAASILLIAISKLVFFDSNNNIPSVVYIDGKQISDPDIINSQALLSIDNIFDVDEDIMHTQIDLLDSFTD